MKKKDKRACSISHISGNRYLLNGTPDREAIENVVADQTYPHIIITVEGGNIRDLPGGVLPLPNDRDYLVFKKLFEVNKRPAMYLLPELARALITAPKGSITVQNDGVTMGDMLFCYSEGSEPVGYISLQSGKTLLFLKDDHMAQNGTAQISEKPSAPAALSATEPQTVSAPAEVNTFVPVPEAVSEPETVSETQPVAPPNKVLSIINAIASDERNFALLKDIAYTAYAIISKVKNSGAATKEEVAACVVAALTDSDTRSRLRRIGNDLYRRFKELNTEAGSVVDLTPGYRITASREIILDEWPDEEIIASIRAGMTAEVVKAHINYDRSLGYCESLISCAGEDYCYIAANLTALSDGSKYGSIYTVRETYKTSRAVYAAQKNDVFFVAIQDGEKIFHALNHTNGRDIFGCYKSGSESNPTALFIDEVIAECMPACPDVWCVTKESVEDVLAALPDKVIRIADPAPSDIKALVSNGFKIGTEKKGDGWLLWAFPAGKALSMPGLPKAIVGSVPQY